MRYLRLNNEVYLVNGKKRSAIYDLNNGFLYSIDQLAVKVINYFISNAIDLQKLSRIENETLNFLIDNNLLVVSEGICEKKEIKDLKTDFLWGFSWLEVTRQCNMSCIFCYEGSDSSCKEKMSFNNFKEAVDNLEKAEVKKIQIIGGEPLLLKDDLRKMISYCRDKFNFIEIYTNGILIDDEWCKFFVGENVNIALSMHSYIPDEHDKIVNRKGAHQMVSKAISLLDKNAIKYRIATVRNKSCVIGESSGGGGYKLCPKEPKLTGRSQIQQYDYAMFKNKVITKNTFQQKLNKKLVQMAVSGTNCFLKSVYIANDLTVYPCVMERRHSYGNLKEKPLIKMQDDEFRLATKDTIDGCRECEYRYACFSCRPDANGRGLYDKPWYCSYNPKSGEWQKPKEIFEKNLLKNGAGPKSMV